MPRRKGRKTKSVADFHENAFKADIPKKLTPAQQRLEDARSQGYQAGRVETEHNAYKKVQEMARHLASEQEKYERKEQANRVWFCTMIYQLGQQQGIKRLDTDSFGTTDERPKKNFNQEPFKDFIR